MKNSLETEKDLKEFYETGNVELARAILNDHFEGNLEYPTAAQDLVTRASMMVKEGRNPQLYGPLIASVIVDPRKKDEKNPQAWRWVSDAVYALRMLGENPEFAKIGYDRESLEELAKGFNKLHADREYRITGFSYAHPETKELIRIDIMDRAA